MTLDTFTAAGTKITIQPHTGAPTTIDLGHPIRSAASATSSDLLFVLVDLPVHAAAQPNLFCIDKRTGKVDWALAAEKVRSKDNVYTELKLKDDRDVLVWDWDGYRTVFDAASGARKESHFFK